jgi:hypothetical protein
MDLMFAGCSSLKVIDLSNYNDNNGYSINGIFFGTPDNLIIIVNNKSNTQRLSSELNSFKCIFKNHFMNLNEYNYKIIHKNRLCVEECYYDDVYKYEYENFCYIECPLGTHSLMNNKYLCEKNRIECTEEYPFISLIDHSCLEHCNSYDFFTKKCELNNNNMRINKIFISNITKDIEDGLMDKILPQIINEKRDLIIKKNNILYQLTFIH